MAEESNNNIASNDNTKTADNKVEPQEHIITPSKSSEELSRAERRKLRKEEFKEQQKTAKTEEGKKKTVKNIIILAVLAAIIVGIVIVFQNLTREQLPTVDDDPYTGIAGAAVTVIEFGDFQCPYTRHFNSAVFPELKKKYGDRIKWVYRDMVTGRHEFSQEDAEAAQCANEQGKFWEFHDLVFERQSGDASSLRGYARIIQMDMPRFDECIKSNRYRSEVNKDYRDGKKAGVSITPTFFVNNIKLQGDIPLQAFEQVLEAELKR